ncbi:MAG: 3' terminal RNA ribose 2'-O-methyltransferase Hen1 [Gammaproteobacteria bacterium]|nr:3' terminal RNA ribose 2'-O-methyltransferase Hen1 [Gammaproteobacteria bacterium]
MLLTISTSCRPALDLSCLLHKNPARLQSVKLSHGQAHIFYPEADEQKCTVALLLDIDPIGLAKSFRGVEGAGHYINDRPYVASSFMSVAIAKAFPAAMNGSSRERPLPAKTKLPLEAVLSVLPANREEVFSLFEPLGYDTDVQTHPLDEEAFPAWEESRYCTVRLKNNITLQELLTHLYVLIPVLDNEKHYWISPPEIDELLKKGEGWLHTHPQREQITRRHCQAMARLTEKTTPSDGGGAKNNKPSGEEETDRLNLRRLKTVVKKLLRSGAKRVFDLGCGEGKLLSLLLEEKQFEYILGADISPQRLETAGRRLKLDELPPKQRARIDLIQGALTYKDKRLEGFDAAAIVEVIEYLDPARLNAFERVVFEFARPATVLLTTPNSEYNRKFKNLPAGGHFEHRFEWTRKEFEAWAKTVGGRYCYETEFVPVGPFDEDLGAPTQLGVFTRF